jgi:hypothetical protein
VGIGHGSPPAGPVGVAFAGAGCRLALGGRCTWLIAGEACGVGLIAGDPVLLAVDADVDVILELALALAGLGGCAGPMGGVPTSSSRRRLFPRPALELSLSPRFVAFSRIWCLVRPGPHCPATQSHSISFDALAALLSSASFLSRSTSSSDQCVRVPPLPDPDGAAGLDVDACGGAGWVLAGG